VSPALLAGREREMLAESVRKRREHSQQGSVPAKRHASHHETRRSERMKLALAHFGRIAHAELDIRPLTVFIGENATNKSWAASALHALLRGTSRTDSEVVKVDSQVVWPDELLSVRAEVWRRAAANPDGEVAASIGAPEDGVDSELNLDAQQLARALAIDESLLASAEARITSSVAEWPGAAKKLQFTLKGGGALLEIGGERVDGVKLEPRFVVTDGTQQAFVAELDDAMSKRIDSVVVLPAERIALGNWALSAAGPLAVIDYLDMLKSAAAARPRNGQWSVDKFRTLLGGTLEYSDDAPTARRLQFRPTHELSLPLHGAHSLVRALAGLWAFLTKLARRGDWLIIDELEMNAHPVAQLALTEYIALLVHDGLNVVFTTHSPYVVDHLQNLITAATLPSEERKKAAAEFVLKSDQAFIDAEKVAVHLFQADDDADASSPVQVHDVLDRTQQLIDWSTFGRVTNQVGSLYSRLLGLGAGK
jgi:predicted ATPase